MAITIPTTQHVKLNPFTLKATCTPSHPQLRDLLVCTPEDPDTVSVVYWDSIVRHDLYATKHPQRTQLRFPPSTLVSGCGLIACGGQNAELAIRSADRSSHWVHQITSGAGSINNSISISPHPLSASTPRLLVSNNDESIKVYDVAGRAPDYARAKRRREKMRMRPLALEEEAVEEEGMDVEEEGVWDAGEKCTLEKVDWAEIKLRTAINHSSVSPDGKRLVAVGDTNEVFLFDVMNNGGYELVHVFTASEDASFSSDWNGSSDKFAIASQDGYVNVYDVRNLPSTSSKPRTVATFQTVQKGPAGAARKVKFSPMGVSSDLMAFTEHRSKVHIVDARTFEHIQIVDVPSSPVSYNPRPLSHRKSTTPRSPSTPTFPISSEVQEVLDTARQRDGGDVYGTSTGFARLLERAAANEGSVSGAMNRVIERELERERERVRERRWGGSYRLQPLRDGGVRGEGSSERLREYVRTDGDEEEEDEEEEDDDEDEDEEEERDEDCPEPPANPTIFINPTSRISTTTILQSRHSRISGPFTSSSPPSASNSIPSGYQSNSMFFPIDNQPNDLLGLDWDEWGESLFVATGTTVWEFGVDERGRRCFGDWQTL